MQWIEIWIRFVWAKRFITTVTFVRTSKFRRCMWFRLWVLIILLSTGLCWWSECSGSNPVLSQWSLRRCVICMLPNSRFWKRCSSASNEMADSLPYFLNSCLTNSSSTADALRSLDLAQWLGSTTRSTRRICNWRSEINRIYVPKYYLVQCCLTKYEQNKKLIVSFFLS